MCTPPKNYAANQECGNAMVVQGGNIDPVCSPKPWGSETFIGNIDGTFVKGLVLLENQSISRQLHIWKRELYSVRSGTGYLELGPHGEVVHELTQGHAVYLPAGVIHRLVAGNAGIEIVEISTRGPVNDILRLGNAHGRQVNPNFDYGRYLYVMGIGQGRLCEECLSMHNGG